MAARIDVLQREVLPALGAKDTGVWDGLVTLHKSPGQHLVAIRMNWFSHAALALVRGRHGIPDVLPLP